jgi:hypothetical protein
MPVGSRSRRRPRPRLLTTARLRIHTPTGRPGGGSRGAGELRASSGHRCPADALVRLPIDHRPRASALETSARPRREVLAQLGRSSKPPRRRRRGDRSVSATRDDSCTCPPAPEGSLNSRCRGLASGGLYQPPWSERGHECDLARRAAAIRLVGACLWCGRCLCAVALPRLRRGEPPRPLRPARRCPPRPC